MKKLWDLKEVFRNLELEGQVHGIIMGVTLLLGPFYTIQTKKDQTFWRGVYNGVYQNDLFLVISRFSSLFSYKFTEASTVKDSEIEIQDRYENTVLSSDFNKEGFSDAFSDFDKELKQMEIDAIKKEVSELNAARGWVPKFATG